MILKILYIDSTPTVYTGSQQGSSTGNISSIAGNGYGNNSLGDYRVITPFYYFVWGLRLRQHRVQREQNLYHCRFVKQPADKVYKSETGGWLDENCVGKWKGEHSSERPGGSNASIVKSYFYTPAPAYMHETVYGENQYGYDDHGLLMYHWIGRRRRQSSALMKSENWIDKYSRTLFVTFHLINPHIPKVLYAQIFFEIMPSGEVIPHAIFRSANFFRDQEAIVLYWNHLPTFGA